jgi:hypothetical protein
LQPPCWAARGRNGTGHCGSYMGTSSSREPEVLLPTLDFYSNGRHFPQVPGPSPVPDRVMRALRLPTIDCRGREFAALGRKVSRENPQNF